ncbi:MAG: Uma2 family endonuclease [Bacteroidetes bacterium]|nr:Uma2 family endonuclease [Bacteroidota bacterium]
MRSLKYDPPSYTVADYNMWEGQWELIDGIPYAMSPSPVHAHQRMAKAIMREMDRELEATVSACGDCEVVYELDWVISKDTVVKPDLAVVCNHEGDFINKAPIIIVEVLSPSTALKDRQTKHDIYAHLGVRYYIIADPRAYTYTVYELIGEKYEAINTTSFLIHEGCTITIDLNAVMIGLQA